MSGSVETDHVQIGNSYYCIYCAKEIEPEEHYHDGGHQGTSYECTCEGIHEAIRIKNEIEKLDDQLLKLQASARDELNKYRYDEAVEKAANFFHQPLPKK